MMEAVAWVSLFVGFISIILGIVSIGIAKRESQQSAENYAKTKEILKEIEISTKLIDRAINSQQTQLLDIINKTLDKIGVQPVGINSISIEEIRDEIKQEYEEQLSEI